MKTATLTVEITVEIGDDIDPSHVTFDRIMQAVPQVDGKDVGEVIGYCTQEYFPENME